MDDRHEPSSCNGDNLPFTPPGPSPTSFTANIIRTTTGFTSNYAPVPTEEEPVEAAYESSLVSAGSNDEADLNEAEKNSLIQQPFGRLATLKHWTLEFVALLASMAAFIVMVILLAISHGKPQPSWAYSVSINTLVATFTTILRAAMLFVLTEVIGQAKWSWMAAPRPLRHVEHFDNAGKGAWGSLQFLLSARKPTPTVIGALVVIASYATGPFSQQAVRTYPCEIPADGVAQILITERVSRMDALLSGAYLTPSMSIAAINGILSIPPDNSQLFRCDSGNCSFDSISGVTHSSVGVCSECADVKSELQEYPYKSKTAYRHPSNYRFHKDSRFGIDTSLEPKLLNVNTVETDPGGNLSTSLLTITLTGCIAQHNPEVEVNRYCKHDYKNMPKLSSDLDIVAANCTLYPCLRHYHGTVANGNLNERLLSTEPMDRDAGERYVSIIQPCIIDNKWYDSSNITNAPRDGLEWTSWTSNGITKEAPAKCVRTLHKDEFRGIKLFLEQNLSGPCKLTNTFEEGSTSLDPNFGIGKGNSELNCDTGWWIGGLYKGGNATFPTIAKAHESMSTAITNRMRVNGRTWSEMDISNSYKNGTCSRTSICVRLEGWWLLYPTALLALTSALLVAAYVQSCRDSGRQPIWKSSILPLLFYNISEEQSSDERNENRHSSQSVPLIQLEELESRADKTVVSFCGGNEGARFVVEERMIEAK